MDHDEDAWIKMRRPYDGCRRRRPAGPAGSRRITGRTPYRYGAPGEVGVVSATIWFGPVRRMTRRYAATAIFLPGFLEIKYKIFSFRIGRIQEPE